MKVFLTSLRKHTVIEDACKLNVLLVASKQELPPVKLDITADLYEMLHLKAVLDAGGCVYHRKHVNTRQFKRYRAVEPSVEPSVDTCKKEKST